LFATTPEEASRSSQSTDWTGLPVIFDEVFTGLYRLGRFTASSFVDVHPDISVHAKLLTGGLLPLCATVASESIFKAFEGDEKTDALLHGHSYTAHAVGCQVALESVRELRRMDERGDWDWAKAAGGWASALPGQSEISAPGSDAETDPGVWSVWERNFVLWVSRQTAAVDGVWALGSVLAIHMKDSDGGGYKSDAARRVQAALYRGSGHGAGRWNVHSRVLGNVLYVLSSQKTSREGVDWIQQQLQLALG